MWEMSLGEFLDLVVRREPDKVFVEMLGETLTYRRFLQKVRRTASMFQDVDRKKDIIRRRGENISSQEVESVIKRHPSVMDCAVIAVPSELGEDEVKAYVACKPDTGLTPGEVVHWAAEHLAYFKVPRYLEIREELPRTPSLRVRKDLLRNEKADLIEGCFDREAAGIRVR